MSSDSAMNEHESTAGGGRSDVGGALPAPETSTCEAVPGVVVDCPHATTCAGCPLIELDYAKQLASTRGRVAGAAAHYPSLESIVTLPVAPAEPVVGYRGRAKLVISPAGAIGLYDRSGHHDVVDIPGCKVLAPALADVASGHRSACHLNDI